MATKTSAPKKAAKKTAAGMSLDEVMRALEKVPENRFQNLAEMRSAIVEAQNRPQPDDETTIMIPRPGRPAPASAEAPWWSPPTPPSSEVNVLSEPQQFGETIVPARPSAPPPPAAPDGS